MKKIFEILPGNFEPRQCILLCEISTDGFSYAIKDDEKNSFTGVAVLHFDKNDEKDNPQFLHEELQNQPLSGNFKKVYIMYSAAENVMIPFSLYTSLENSNLLNLIHGDLSNNDFILTDLIAEKGVYNVYRMPGSIVNVIKSRFPGASTIHQSSILLNKAPTSGDKLSLIFYSNKLVVALFKNGATRFINTFFYTTPEDVTYALLNICKQFDAGDIPIEISGLVEEDSSLYKEIYKYFSSVTFAPLSENYHYTEEITNNPSHYFSHIFAVDQCE